MTTHLIPGSRVADYFFVAGVHDNHIIPAFESAKKHQRMSDNDYSYYRLQEVAVANNGVSTKADYFNSVNSPSDTNSDMHRRRSSHFQTDSPSLQSIFPDSSTSLSGVLDHVQSVIDNFDKERDSARDNVIAVHELPHYAHKYNRTDSEKTITPNHRSSRAFSVDTRRSSSKDTKWRSNSESKAWSPEIIANVRSETMKTPNIFDIRYTPTILMRYPEKNYSPQEPFPAYAAMFCFPRDISLHHGDRPLPEKMHSFAMTDENGATLYGTCIVFYERLSQKLIEPVNKIIQEWVRVNMEQSTIEYAHHLLEKIKEEERVMAEERERLSQITVGLSRMETYRQRSQLEEHIKTCQENIELYNELLEPVKMAVCEAKDIWIPKSIGLLGKMPWMNLYGDWIKILVDNVVGVGGHKHLQSPLDIHSTLVHFIEDIPLPPPGKYEIGLTIDKKSLFFSRPPANQVPILKNFSLYPLFRALSPHLILAILETLLSEGRVVFLSKYPGMLSIACESFRYLMFPFYWQFVFIPVLPERLLTCLQAPVPYIIGFQGSMNELYEHIADDTCIVNLDSNSMHQTERSILIPERQRRKLQASLEQYAPLHTRCKIPYGVPLTVQCSYPRGKMILNCNRSNVEDLSAPHRKSESSDGTSAWSHNASVISKPSEFWSVNSTRTSDESSVSMGDLSTRHFPQFPGSAMLSTSIGNYSTSINSPPMNHIHPTMSIQSSLSSSSTQSRTAQRISLSNSPITAASPPVTHAVLDNEHPYYKPSGHKIDTSPKRRSSYKFGSANNDSDLGRNKLSSFMSKPRAVFQNDHDHPTPSTSSSAQYHDQEYYKELPRRMKYIEGHIMAEIFMSELINYQDYRCVCGKQVNDQEEAIYNKHTMFMCCQECHLVTHETCTDEILHPCLPACFDEQKVCNAFIRMFASLLYNYRSGFVDETDDKSRSNITATENNMDGKRHTVFSKDVFLKHSDKDTRSFLSNLCSSQMFTQFITDRLMKSSHEPEILVFDEYIKLKLNRSKLKFVKEETPFLNDESLKVSQVIWATQPEELYSESTSYDRFPIHIRPHNN